MIETNKQTNKQVRIDHTHTQRIQTGSITGIIVGVHRVHRVSYGAYVRY